MPHDGRQIPERHVLADDDFCSGHIGTAGNMRKKLFLVDDMPVHNPRPREDKNCETTWSIGQRVVGRFAVYMRNPCIAYTPPPPFEWRRYNRGRGQIANHLASQTSFDVQQTKARVDPFLRSRL